MKLLAFLSLFFTLSAAADSPRRIWIDTDAACGARLFSDVDDCLAIALLLSDPAWEIVGISSVFGNASVTKTDRTVRRLLDIWCSACISVYRGADSPALKTTPASRALAAALIKEPLTVFVLGPASNISAALKTVGELSHHHKFIAVAGTRQKKARFRVSKLAPFTFPDLNYSSDPDAFEYLLNRRVDLTLMPFELAQQVTLRRDHIQAFSGEYPQLGVEARRWLWLWRLFLGKSGFHPFDAVGVSIILENQTGLSCSKAYAERILVPHHSGWTSPIKILHVSLTGSRGNVTYCHRLRANFADVITERLARPLKAID